MKKLIFFIKISKKIFATGRCFLKVESKNLIFWIYEFQDVILHFRTSNQKKKFFSGWLGRCCGGPSLNCLIVTLPIERLDLSLMNPLRFRGG